jgi:uncharacterized membrane protein
MAPDANDAAGASAPAASGSGDPFDRRDPPLYQAALWPHRSMTRSGFRWFMGALAAGLSIPMLAAGATPVGLFLAPFLVGALALAWWMIRLNDRRRARQGETVRLWADCMAVEHRTPRGRALRWSANPYWVSLDLSDTRTVERYLTLTGAGRTIEVGAFLTPEERSALADELGAALKAVREGRRPEMRRGAVYGDPA